jgi:carboxyl-terminal processing protease
VRAFRIILAFVLTFLVLALVFLGGYVVNDLAHPNRTDLTRQERQQANAAGDLQARIMAELLGRYYKKVDVDKLEKAGVDGTLKALKDPYTVYMTAEETKKFNEETQGEYSGIGVQLNPAKGGRTVIADVFEGSPAAEADLKPGDEIVTVDGWPTRGKPVDVTITHIKGPEGTQVKLSIRRPGAKGLIPVTLTRRTIKIPETQSRIINDKGTKVGYLRLDQFANGVGDTVRQQIDQLEAKGAQAIVLDLRYNPGGLLTEAVDVSGDFIGKGLVVTTEGLHSPREDLDSEEQAATSLPVFVLQNRWSASASEITAGALQDHERATIVGTRSFGKACVQSIVDMPDGATLKITTAIYLTPDGRDINKKGIKPDIKAPDDPKTKKDETLQAALQAISTGI